MTTSFLHLGRQQYEILTQRSENNLSKTFYAERVIDRHPLRIVRYEAAYLTADIIQKMIKLAERLVTVRHPNLDTLLDFGIDQGYFYALYEAPQSTTALDKYLADRSTLELPVILKIAHQLLDALKTLEELKLFSGSIRPSQILISTSLDIQVTNSLFPLVILKNHSPQFSKLEDGLFFAPEFLIHHQYTLRSDIYSFGMVLYYMLTQSWPYDNSDEIGQLKSALLYEPVLPKSIRPSLPDGIEALILKCIDMDALQRFATISDLQAAFLDPAFSYRSRFDERHPLFIELEKDVAKWKKKRRLRIAALSTLGIFALIIFIIVYMGMMKYVAGNPEVKVPNVVGLSTAEAEQMLSALQLEALTVTSDMTLTIPEGHVTASKPQAGQSVKQNRKIVLFISSGISGPKAPLLIGEPASNAAKLLEGLDVKLVQKSGFSYKFPKGTIVDQRPFANEHVTNNIVMVVVSNGFPIKLDVTPMQASGDGSNTAGEFYGGQAEIYRVTVLATLLKGEPAQTIDIYYKQPDAVQKLYSQTHTAGEEIQLAYEVDPGGTIEVYFNNILAIKKKILPANPAAHATSTANPSEF